MDRVSVHVAVDTLEYLQKGGRSGGAFTARVRAQFKPILRVERRRSGAVRPGAHARQGGGADVRDRHLAGAFEGDVRGVFGGREEARALIDRLRPYLPPTDLFLGQIGPGLASIPGPGAAWYRGTGARVTAVATDLTRVRRVFELERERGCDNKAVMGGLDRMCSSR
jgi:hypothetical protein